MAQSVQPPGQIATATERPAADIDRGDEVAIGTQLAWRLRALILSGRLAAGERLPGVRELAAAGAVNVNTARSIYRRLEDDGLAVSRHGLGTFVAADAVGDPALEQIAAEASEAALALGIEPRDLARTLYVGSPAEHPDLPQAGPPPATALEAAPSAEDEASARRGLRSQIAKLEAELAPYTEHLGLSDDPAPVTEPAGRIAGIGELEAIRDGLLDRLDAARAAAGESSRRESGAREKLRRMVEDPSAHRYEVVTNEELGEPGCTTYEVRPAWGPVGALMNWWQVRVSGGCPSGAPA